MERRDDNAGHEDPPWNTNQREKEDEEVAKNPPPCFSVLVILDSSGLFDTNQLKSVEWENGC